MSRGIRSTQSNLSGLPTNNRYVLLAAALPFDEPTLALLFDRIQRADYSYPR